MLEARDAVKKLHTYRPPLAGRTGLRLDFNESTIGCSPRVLAGLRSLDADCLARYPEREPVEKLVARFLGLDAPQVLLTNGVDEAIHLLCSTYLEPGDEALIVVPTFAMYAIFALAEGARVIEVPAGDNFAFPTRQLLAQISPRTRLIAVANPNNPTGAAVAGNVLTQIAQAAPQAAVLVDEAYFEFHGETIIDRTRKSRIFSWRALFPRPTDLPVCELASLRETRGKLRWFGVLPRPTASTWPRLRFCRRRFTIRNM
jgi:histidinol-phosphate aminotransferase